MKTLVIGDIHGRSTWKQIINQDFDRVIFVGDYVDTHESIAGLEQVENLREIINLKETSNKEVILLIGNHDHHYWPGVGYSGTSGYQPGMAKTFEYEFETYKKLFQMAYVDEFDRVYTHAGVTENFLYRNSIDGVDIRTIVDNINIRFEGRPKDFLYYPGDRSGSGDHIAQSPIWVRPNSLYRDGIKQLQIIGHTQVNKINPLKSERQGYYLIDALGTSGEYLLIEDKKITIGKI